MFRSLAGVFAAVLLVAAPAARGDEALDLAKKLTTEGARLFAAKNAAALTDTYTEDARVELLSREDSTGSLKREARTGKSEVRALYDDLFKDNETIEARNDVAYARFVGNDMLLIVGTFEMTSGGKTMKLPFVQARVRQDGQWLMVSVQLFLVGQ
jgi:ketosteroid isomerase-like protein